MTPLYESWGMERVRAIGGFLVVVAVAAYVVGVLTAYPGREFSLTLFLAGATLFGVGGSE